MTRDAHDAHDADPPCPYCGERQRYSEARPSRPTVRVDPCTRQRSTEWHTECRACGQRITWAMSFRLTKRSKAIYSWECPSQ